MAKSYALVTGATSGIGLELARLLAKDQYSLILVARDAKRLEATAKDLAKESGGKVETVALDLGKVDAAQELFDKVKQKGWEVEALVNNAGFGDFGFFHEESVEKIQSMLRVNVDALTMLTRLFLPAMVKRKSGKVLNLASTAAFQPGPLMAVYYATKAYVLSFTEAIANEVEGTGVTVSALCPGPTESGFQQRAAMEESKLVRGKKIMDAPTVAALGYKAWMKGKTVTITGFKNKVMAFSTRATPRGLLTKMVRQMQDRATS